MKIEFPYNSMEHVFVVVGGGAVLLLFKYLYMEWNEPFKSPINADYDGTIFESDYQHM